MSEGLISVWMNMDEYREYTNGLIAYGGAIREPNRIIHVSVPMSHVVYMDNNNYGGIEIRIKKQ